MRVKELIDARQKLWAEAQAILDKPDATAEDGVRVDAMFKEIDDLKAKIDRAEKADAIRRQLDEPIETRAGRGDPDGGDADGAKKAHEAAYTAAFRNYMLHGQPGRRNARRRAHPAHCDRQRAALADGR
jgi:HK97 family phage major capsid protein